MKKKCFPATVLCLLLGPAFASSPHAKENIDVFWRLGLDPGGNVTTLLPALVKASKALRTVLEPAIRNWKFTPGMVNGVPAATETTLRVNFSLVPSADGNAYSVKFNYVQTGGAPGDHNYPPPMTWSQGQTIKSEGHSSALVVLIATYDVDGKVIAVAPTDQSPVTKGSLLTLATKTLRNWNFVPERVAGTGIAGTVIVPFCFSVSSSDVCERVPGNLSGGNSGQEALALDTKVHLLTDIFKDGQ